MEITINGQSLKFEMQSWWGPMYLYEEIMNVAEHPENTFNPAKTMHLHVMFYCILMDDNDGLTLTLDDFLKAVNDLKLHAALLKHYTERTRVLLQLQSAESKPAGTSKKKSSRRMTPTKE